MDDLVLTAGDDVEVDDAGDSSDDDVEREMTVLAEAFGPLELRPMKLAQPPFVSRAFTICLAIAAILHASFVGVALWFYESPMFAFTPDRAGEVDTAETPSLSEVYGLRDGVGDASTQLDLENELQAARDADRLQPELSTGRPQPVAPPPAEQASSPARQIDRVYPTLPPSEFGQLTAALTVPETPAENGESLEPNPSPNVADQSSEASQAPPSESTDPADEETEPAVDEPPGDRFMQLFAEETTMTWVNGRVVAQAGRDFKIAPRRTGLATFAGAIRLPPNTRLRFIITTDKDGRPLSVVVDKSSGRQAVDEHFRQQLLESWFEPDPTGDGSAIGVPFAFVWVLR
ncbi:MAG: hypothetical protein AAGK78_09140 [Planctomycetota bacterium]